MFGGSSFSPEKDIPDLSGEVFLVTGGNTGLGKETVLQLAKHSPAHIYLAARTASKAETAIQEIKSLVPSAPITFIPLDLTSFASISACASQFASLSARLDVLINNAGVMALPPGTTKEGYEIQFGTNHMGHALLTKLLMPKLLSTAEKPGADVRIVNVSSEGHNLAPSRSGVVTDSSKLNESYGPWGRYGNSKLANILFSQALASRYPSITSVSLHPGLIATDLYATGKSSNSVLRYGMAVLQPVIFSTVPQGTRNQLWCATTKREGLKNGGYYKPVGRLSAWSGYTRNEEMAEKLWEWTQRELAEKGF